MTPKERVLAALCGQPYDIIPAMNITSTATISAMKYANAFFPKAHYNTAEIIDLASTSHDLFGFDSIAPYFSVHLEAAALGVDIDWGDCNKLPCVVNNPVKDITAYKIPSNLWQQKEITSLLEAEKILQKRYQNKVAIIGKVIGPWTLAYHLRGVENFLLDTILEPDKTKAFLNTLVEISLTFARMQKEAGVDALVWADHVTSDLVPPKLYEQILYPIHKRVIKDLNNVCPVILHVCGEVSDRFDLFASAGFSCFHADSRNNIPKLIEKAKGKITIAGCLNNPFTLLCQSPEDVKKEVENNIADGIRIISPECALPTSVPTENLRSLVNTTHTHNINGKPL